eukprot:TRINITY_DN4048_c0_g1_i2.p1 TRINITY_DN4048_c0_g1~~TRINITY_DN4048_c0_g1_i2.p1  ORF type:complete len:2037 (+),score=707.13 TRINITY_DN4048_c0_g1_i2:125-6112(+)
MAAQAAAVRTLAQLRTSLEAVHSHGARMRFAADVGRSGKGQLDGLFKEAAERANAWEAIYVVVAAQACKSAPALEAIIIKHHSWVARARAAKALCKVDAGATARLLVDPLTPIQMRPILARGATRCTSESLDVVLAASWGGAGAALHMLRRCPVDDHHSALAKQWLPRLLPLVKDQRTALGSSGDSGTKYVLKYFVPDCQYSLQSFAAKHPQAVLEMLRENWTWTDMWYRAAMVLARSHPEDMLGVLRRAKGNPKAAWMLAQPLARHRPRELLEVLVQRGVFDDTAKRSLRNLIDGIQYGPAPGDRIGRGEVLALTTRIIDAPRDNKTDSLVSLVKILRHPRRRACAKGLAWHIAALLAKDNKLGSVLPGLLKDCPPDDAQLTALLAGARQHKTVAAATSALETLKRKVHGVPESRVCAAWEASASAEGAQPLLRLIMPERTSPTAVSSSTLCSLFDALPAASRPKEAAALFEEKCFAEMTSEAQAAVLSHLQVKRAFPRLKKLATDRNWTTRKDTLISLIHCGVRSEELADVFTFVELRLQNEQSEVKGPVLEAFLKAPARLLIDEHIPVLQSLLANCLRWPKQTIHHWVPAWTNWVAELVAYELSRVTTDQLPVNALITFSGTVTEQLDAAGRKKDDSAEMLHSAARLLFSTRRKQEDGGLGDPWKHPAVPHAVDFLVRNWLGPKLARLRTEKPLVTKPPSVNCSSVQWLRTVQKGAEKGKPDSVTHWREEARASVLLEAARVFVQAVTPAGLLRSGRAQEEVAAVLRGGVEAMNGELRDALLVAAYVLSQWSRVDGSGRLMRWPPLAELLHAAIGVLHRAASNGDQWACPKGTPSAQSPDGGQTHYYWVAQAAMDVSDCFQTDAVLRHSVPLARGMLCREVESALARQVSSWVQPPFVPFLDAMGAAIAAIGTPPAAFQTGAMQWARNQCSAARMRYLVRWSPAYVRGAATAAGTCIRAFASRGLYGKDSNKQDSAVEAAASARECLAQLSAAYNQAQLPADPEVLGPLCGAAQHCLERAQLKAAACGELLRLAEHSVPKLNPRIERGGSEGFWQGPDSEYAATAARPPHTSYGHPEARRPRYRWQRGNPARNRKNRTRRLRGETEREWARNDRGPDRYAAVRAVAAAACQEGEKLAKGSTDAEVSGWHQVVSAATNTVWRLLQGKKLAARHAEAVRPLLGLLRKGIDTPETRATTCKWISSTSTQVAKHAQVSSEKLAAWPELGQLLEHAISLPVAPAPLTVEKSRRCKDRRGDEKSRLEQATQIRAKAVSAWLTPRWMRRRRAEQLLSSPAAADLVSQSTALAGYVLRERQDLLHLLFDPAQGCMQELKRTGRWPLSCLAIYQAYEPRFAGQMATMTTALPTVPPAAQRAFFDKWVAPHAFCLKRQNVHGEHEDTDDAEDKKDAPWPEDPAEPVLGHCRQAMLLWVAVSMPCPAGLPPVNAKEHPFEVFLAESLIENEASRAEDEANRKKGGKQAVTRKSKEEVQLEVTRARRAKLCKELINALRIIDDSASVAQVLSVQVTAGLSTYARPGLCDALRCVSPELAGRMLEDVLSRKHQRKADCLAAGVGARAQLVRAAVRLQVPQAAAESLLLTEWKGRGTPPGPVEEGDEGTAKDIKVNIICSLAVSRLSGSSKALWALFEQVAAGAKADAASDDRYVATELLKSLAGTSQTETLNSSTWPRHAPDGLAGLAASLSEVRTLQPLCIQVLTKYQKFLNADSAATVSGRDADQCIAAAGCLMEEDSTAAVSLLMTLDTKGRPGTLLAATRTMVAAADAARQAFDVDTEVKVRDGILQIGKLPNWQLRSATASVANVARFLIGARLAPVGISLRVSLLDFTAPQGADLLAAELKELAEATAAADWQSLAPVLSSAITKSVDKQRETRGDAVRDAMDSTIDLLAADPNPHARYVAVALCEGVIEGGHDDKYSLRSAWGRKLFRLRADGTPGVGNAADAAFARLAEELDISRAAGAVHTRGSDDDDDDDDDDFD